MSTTLALATFAGVMTGFFALAVVGAVLVVIAMRRFRKPVAADSSEVFDEHGAPTVAAAPPTRFDLAGREIAPAPAPASRLDETEARLNELLFAGLVNAGVVESDVAPGEGIQLEGFAEAPRRGLSNCHDAGCEPCGRAGFVEPFSMLMLPASPDAHLLKAMRDGDGNVVIEAEDVIVAEPVFDEAPPVDQVVETLRRFRNTSVLPFSKLPEADCRVLIAGGAPAPFGTGGPTFIMPAHLTLTAGEPVDTSGTAAGAAAGSAPDVAPAAAPDRKVARVEITPKHFTCSTTGDIEGRFFSARAFNAAGDLLAGARVKFKTTNPARLFVAQRTGELMGKEAGYASVYAVCQGIESARARVRVRD